MKGPARWAISRAGVRAALLGAAVAMSGLTTLSGCGSSDQSAIARVQGTVISRAALMHQMVIENAQLEGAASQIPVPDPPSYVRCIAAAGVVQARLKHGTKLSRQELRRRCAQVYTQLRDGALAFLITADWLQGEAATQGVAVSSSEVDASYRHLLDGPTGPAFARRLRLSGMTSADELLQLRIDKLAEKLRTKIGRRQRIDAFLAAYRQRWKQRTTCRPGYVVAECRNGPPLPASRAG